MMDPRRQRVRELAHARGVPYGMKLPEELFRQAGYSDAEVVDLFDENRDTYHIQDEDDHSVVPVAIVLDALKGTIDDRYQDIEHLANRVVVGDLEWFRELDRLLFNLYMRDITPELRELTPELKSHGIALSRRQWLAMSRNDDSDDPVFNFCGSLDEAIKLFKPGTRPHRIPWEPIAVCVEALQRWESE